MITANIVLPAAAAAYSVVLPTAPDAVNLVFRVAYGPDFAAADFASVDYYTSVLF